MKTEVLVYTKATCIYCQKIKQWLEENGISFKEIDLLDVEDSDLLNNIQGVPYTVLKKEGKEEVIIGFNQNTLRELLL